MKFYKLDDIVAQSGDRVFKVSPVGKGIALVVLAALGLGSLGLAVAGGWHSGSGDRDDVNLPAPLFYLLAGVILIFGLFAWQAFRASLQPSNWLLRCTASGVIIHFRSYLNWRFPPGDVAAVGFDYGEIAWARTVKEKRIMPGHGQNAGKDTAHLTYLDLGLAPTDTTELEALIAKEHRRVPDGVITSCDYPVSVRPGGLVELRWGGGLSPGVAQAIQCLGQRVRLLAADARAVDLSHDRRLRPEQEQGKILEPLNSGDEMGALKLTQEIFGYNPTQAQEYVDKLQPDEER